MSEQTTGKQLQIAAILSAAAIMYNLDTVNTEEEWIAAQLDVKEVQGHDLSNNKAKEVAEKLGLKLSKEECETILEKPDKIEFKEKYKIEHCKSKLKMK